MLFKNMNWTKYIYKYVRIICELCFIFVNLSSAKMCFFADIAESPIDCVTLRQILDSHDTGNSYRGLQLWPGGLQDSEIPPPRAGCIQAAAL